MRPLDGPGAGATGGCRRWCATSRSTATTCASTSGARLTASSSSTRASAATSSSAHDEIARHRSRHPEARCPAPDQRVRPAQGHERDRRAARRGEPRRRPHRLHLRLAPRLPRRALVRPAPGRTPSIHNGADPAMFHAGGKRELRARRDDAPRHASLVGQPDEGLRRLPGGRPAARGREAPRRRAVGDRPLAEVLRVAGGADVRADHRHRARRPAPAAATST